MAESAAVGELRSRLVEGGGWTPGPAREEGAARFATVEATVLAWLALAANGERLATGHAAATSGWIAARQQADGGFEPHVGVSRSTWVTSLVLLLPFPIVRSIRWRSAVEWLLRQEGRESSLVTRVREVLITGDLRGGRQRSAGWPFFPETASWVTPTAFALLALRKVRDLGEVSEYRREIDRRLSAAREFLIARQCADGGWNHGSTRALGYEAPSYPETTGLALKALQGMAVPSVKVELGKAAARRHRAACRSVEALRWLELGLMSQGETLDSLALPRASMRPLLTSEIAIDLIARAAMRAPGKRSVLEPSA
jgi:hypothetical protein